jgi:hypothetical protein
MGCAASNEAVPPATNQKPHEINATAKPPPPTLTQPPPGHPHTSLQSILAPPNHPHPPHIEAPPPVGKSPGRPQLTLSPPGKTSAAATSVNEDAEIKRLLNHTHDSELDERPLPVPNNASKHSSVIIPTARRYDIKAFFGLQSIKSIIEQKIATKEKMLELFDILDDDKDGFLTEIEIDDIVYLVKTSYQEKEQPSQSSKQLDATEGPIMSAGIQLDLPPSNKHNSVDNLLPINNMETSPKSNRKSQSQAQQQQPSEFQQDFDHSTNRKEKDRISTSINPQINPAMNLSSPPPPPPPVIVAAAVPAAVVSTTTDSPVKTPLSTNPQSQKRKPTTKKFMTPTMTPTGADIEVIASPKTETDKSPRLNMMSDFTDILEQERVDQNLSPRVHSKQIVINVDGQHKTIIEKHEHADTPKELVGPIPHTKKGFLITSPAKETRYHVLDSGMLYCIDSNSKSPMSFALDRTGVPLKGRSLSILADNTLQLVPTQAMMSQEQSFTGEFDVIELKPRNDREKEDWIVAIKEHIAFMDRQPNGSD